MSICIGACMAPIGSPPLPPDCEDPGSIPPPPMGIDVGIGGGTGSMEPTPAADAAAHEYRWVAARIQ
ncbi:MAG: hypothetical protein JOZ49_00410 [Mycolicibacterium sp.]|nr:hypothetical protein [Mycolicibacterium sp.]